MGDNAEMCLIELVDFNDIYGSEAKTPKKKARSRRGSGKATAKAPADAATEEVKPDEAETKENDKD